MTAARIAPSPAKARWTLLLLSLANIFNVADRALLGVVTEPVRQELMLSDTQMSLASGFLFVTFNLAAGLFLSRFIDRGHRIRILAAGIAGWSIATAATGLAQDFPTLALARIGVGIGEATAFPAAMSLIPDLFRADARGRAVGVFQSSVFVGIVGGTVLAGVLGAALGWRMMFVWAGVAGVGLALVVWLFAHEPARGAFAKDGTQDDFPMKPPGQLADLVAGLKRFRQTPGFMSLSLSYATAGMLTSVLAAWGPAFLQRSHAVPLEQVGLVIGPPVGIGGIVGTLVSGAIADRLVRRHGDPRAMLLVPLVVLPLSVPFVLGFVLAKDLALAMTSAAVMNFLLSCSAVPAINYAVSSVAPGERATTATIMLISAGLIASGLAPFIVGVLSDQLTPDLGPEGLRYAISAMVLAPVIATGFMVMARRATRASA